jgi:hypothetical protein
MLLIISVILENMVSRRGLFQIHLARRQLSHPIRQDIILEWRITNVLMNSNHVMDLSLVKLVDVDNPGIVGWVITNSTACKDVYVQGWQHWCKSDTKDCIKQVRPS